MRTRIALLAAASTFAGILPAAASAPGLPVPGPTSSPSPPSRAPGAAAPCTIEGTGGPDRLTGTPGPDVLCGMGGNDALEGLEGEDVLDGGPGADTATWETAACCVHADIAAGSATGPMGTDRLVGIERVTGSAGADVLRGGDGPNILDGRDGTDLLYGGEGDDTLLGGAGDDWLAGEGGANHLDAADGADICADAAGLSCDPISPPDGDDVRGPLDLAQVVTQLSGDPAVWRLRVRRRAPAARLWDEGYAMVSLDTRGDDRFDLHALVRWTKKRVRGMLIREGARKASGRLRARRAGGRGVLLRVPPGRMEIEAGRPYYRWAAQSIFTGKRCRPCIDGAPSSGGYPQPVWSG